MPKTHYRRSPGLDGLRGLFMAGFMAFHFGASFLAGGWIAINHFFVLSGFLITRLLVEEYEERGTVSFAGFYLRRARRILPGLLAMLSVVTVWAIFFAADTDKRRFGGDVLATLGFFMNWRLISQSDDYFGNQLHASPLRHAWTLSIEEQFYVLVPLAVILLMRYVRGRRLRTGIPVVLAVAATVWTSHIAYSDPSAFARLYYGTDTRVTSLLLGSALGFALGWSRRSGLVRGDARLFAGLGWLTLALSAYLMIAFDPYTPWMYTKGGQFLGAVAAVGVIASIVLAPQGGVARMLSWKPLRRFGQLSYSMYLWHWPLRVWMGEDSLFGSALITGLVEFGLAVGLAYVSDRFLEQPILRHGVRGVLRRARRGWPYVAVPVAAIVLVTSIGLLPAPSPDQVGAVETNGRPAALVPKQPGYLAGQPTKVAVYGDSVPWYLVKRFPAKAFPGVTPVNLAHEGCNFLELRMKTVFGPQDQSQFCGTQRKDWPTWLKTSGAPVFLIFGDSRLGVPHYLPNGQLIQLGQPLFEQTVMNKMDEVWKRAQASGAKQIQVVTVPCRKFGYAADENAQAQNAKIAREMPGMVTAFEDPSQINAIYRKWVARTPGAKLVDLDGAICTHGYTAKINGVTVFNDGLHFSPQITPSIWSWMLGQVSRNWAARS
ncbi:acyltransferase family protein [Calidifontibacter terrae]